MASLRFTYEGEQTLVVTDQNGGRLFLGNGTEIQLKLLPGMALDIREGQMPDDKQVKRRPKLTVIKGDKHDDSSNDHEHVDA